ncbi:MAG: hypothetical protein BIFFINMI_03394 [Phycisphaerae bacterium]|nr:hypothetical protein [Phycisphaerae bacterium]
MSFSRSTKHAFTLIELMVIVAILAVLISILLPSMERARAITRRTMCMSNLRQIGVAIYAYADDYKDTIPFGPAPGTRTITNFYPTLGMPTSLISLEGTGGPVGLGLLLQKHLSNTPKVLFCPDADQRVDAEAELAKVGSAQAQCDYYYRHGSGGDMLHPSGTTHIHLSNLGDNTRGRPIKAMVMDANYLCDPSLAVFHVIQRTNHRQENVNVLYSDGHVGTLSNADGKFTVDVGASPYDSFAKMLGIFENADAK